MIVIIMRFAVELLQSHWSMNNTPLPSLLLVEFTTPLDPCVMQLVLMNTSRRSPRCRPSTRAPSETFRLPLPASERREREGEAQRNTVC